MRTPASHQWRAFASYVKAMRSERRLGVREFARQLAIAPGYVCKIEYALTAPPSLPILHRMARVLDVDELSLMCLAGRLPPHIMAALWAHPAMPAILSTVEHLGLERATTFCQQVTVAPDDPLDETQCKEVS
jgi:transcriptional regulator with XRE-family HTH domain